MFSKRLKELRAAAKISQAELAEELEISNRTISMYEQGKSEPNAEILIKIATYFHVTTDYLLELSNVKTANVEISYISSYLGLTERSIDELHRYSGITKEGDQWMLQQQNTLNMLFEPRCELLKHITDYLHFSATHFKNFNDETNDSLTPIADLELWDNSLNVGYSDDWDMWSKALLLIIEEELVYLRQESLNKRFSSESDGTAK